MPNEEKNNTLLGSVILCLKFCPPPLVSSSLPIPTLTSTNNFFSTPISASSIVPFSPPSISSPPFTPLSQTTPFYGHVDIPLPDKSLKGAEKVAATIVMKEMDSMFNNIYGDSFSNILTKIQASNLQLKLSPSQRKISYVWCTCKIVNVKLSIKKEVHSRDASTLFGTRQARSQYEQQRLALHFVTKEHGRSRTVKVILILMFLISIHSINCFVIVCLCCIL